MIRLDLVLPFLIGAVCITAICAHYLRREPGAFLLVYLWSTGLLIAVLALETDPASGSVVAAKDIAVLMGVVLLGAGWLGYGSRGGHLLAMAGWQGLGIYWLMELPNYLYLHPEDPTNVILYAPALALFSVFSFHEWDSYRTGQNRRALKFIAGLTFLAAGTYFLFAKVPFFSSGLIWVTATQTSWLINLFGMDTTVGGVVVDVTGEISVPVIGSGISIILACTGIEAIVIFLGAFIAVEPRDNPWAAYKRISPRMKRYQRLGGRERKTRALLYTIPPIWVLNLVRNASIIWLVQNAGVSFDVAHGYVGKLFSFLVLLGLAMIVFDLVPEIYDDLLDLYRLGRPEKEEGTGDGGQGTGEGKGGQSEKEGEEE